MHEATLIITDDSLPPDERYAAIERAARALIEGGDAIAAMANVASLLYHSLPAINWCGFYRASGTTLIVGPFCGKPACVEIAFGRGVCGAAAAERRTVIVEDVTEFPGHIACDPESRSEIVVPLLDGERVVGVLDLDSPQPRRFSSIDARWLERIAQLVVERWRVAPCCAPAWH